MTFLGTLMGNPQQAQSAQSPPIYSPGTWGKDGDTVTFTPSATNMKNMSVDELKKYFAKVEPDVKLLLPDGGK